MIAAIRSNWLSAAVWWSARSGRERLLLAALAVAALTYLVTVGVARPLLTANAAARESIARSESALARLAAVPDGAVVAAPASDQPATAVITATATDYGMSIRRIEPEGDGARVTIDDAGFEEVLRWIQALEDDHGLHLAAIEMDRRPEPGIVSATMTLQR